MKVSFIRKDQKAFRMKFFTFQILLQHYAVLRTVHCCTRFLTVRTTVGSLISQKLGNMTYPALSLYLDFFLMTDDLYCHSEKCLLLSRFQIQIRITICSSISSHRATTCGTLGTSILTTRADPTLTSNHIAKTSKVVASMLLSTRPASFLIGYRFVGALLVVDRCLSIFKCLQPLVHSSFAIRSISILLQHFFDEFHEPAHLSNQKKEKKKEDNRSLLVHEASS